jgi:hypothetical protein
MIDKVLIISKILNQSIPLWGIIINWVESSYQNMLNGLSGWYNLPCSEFTLDVLLTRGVISSIKGSSSSVSGTMCTGDFFLPISLEIAVIGSVRFFKRFWRTEI